MLTAGVRKSEVRSSQEERKRAALKDCGAGEQKDGSGVKFA